jgi:hypothetical protein
VDCGVDSSVGAAAGLSSSALTAGGGVSPDVSLVSVPQDMSGKTMKEQIKVKAAARNLFISGIPFFVYII